MSIRKIILIVIAIILNINFNILLPLRIKKNITRTFEKNN